MRFVTISVQETGKVLDLPNGTSSPVDPVQQFHKNTPGLTTLGSLNQQWILRELPTVSVDIGLPIAMGPAIMQIVSRLTGQGLRVNWDDFQRDLRPLHVFQWPIGPNDLAPNQTWIRRMNDDGSFCVMSMLAPDPQRGGRAMDIPEDHFNDDHTPIQLWPFHGRATQRFTLIEQDVQVVALISRGNYLVWDVPGFVQGPTAIQQYCYNGGTNQLWTISPDINAPGPHAITSVCSGLSLAVDTNDRLALAHPSDDPSQRWRLIFEERDSFLLQNSARPDLALDCGGRAEMGDVLDWRLPAPALRSIAGGGNQEWWAVEVQQLFQPIEPAIHC